jgi:L-amino acid N-acyltransferase YncA
MTNVTDANDISEVDRYLQALRDGYVVFEEAIAAAANVGAQIPERLLNETSIGRFQLSELIREFEADPQSLLSPPYAPLTEAAVLSQSRALAFVELWYRDALKESASAPEVQERLARANEAAAGAAGDLSAAWRQLWELVQQATAQPTTAIPLPRELTLGDLPITLRRMDQGDGPMIVQFARALPPHDLMFLRRDITDPEQVEAWLRDAASGLSETVLAFHEDKLVGYATAVSDGLNWTRHVRELRVVVAPEMRGRRLGRLLTEQAFATARTQGAKKMIAQMTTDQTNAVLVFETLGFEREAVLRNHVMDRDGGLHDLQIMSLDIEEFRAKLLAAVSEP